MLLIQNYTLAREQIDDIQSAGNWLNARKELLKRNKGGFISSFKNSVSTLDELATTENLGTINNTQIIIEEFNKIEQAIGQPVIDFQRWFW